VKRADSQGPPDPGWETIERGWPASLAPRYGRASSAQAQSGASAREWGVPPVGAGRKQALASNNIFTAADIDADNIRTIKGLGDVLTKSLLAWKEDVRRQFRFNPATALSPNEQAPIIVKFRNRQQQILGQIAQQINYLESLASRNRATLEKLIPELRRTLAHCQQANADVHGLFGKG
jgi:DNA-binding helix-hairpin-helix protein with protein kinase domain